jgi:hypothetical protein
MDSLIAELDGKGLLDLIRSRQLEELEVLQVLRSPYCTAQVAEEIASDRRLLDGHAIRERLAGFPGFNFSRAMDFLGTLPWTSLITLAQAPKTPPVVRRQAERRILTQFITMALGEKVALARRAHRAIFGALMTTGDSRVLSALLNNPRLVENDILIILNTSEPPPEFFTALARHHKWGQYFRVRRALVECPHTPYPLALSILVQLPSAELERALGRPDLPENIRSAASSLLEREVQGQRRVIIFSGDVGNGGAAQPPEDLR